MATLDRSKPYVQVVGQADHAFRQGDKLFDDAGNEVGAAESSEPSKPAKAGKAKPADDQVAAQLGE